MKLGRSLGVKTPYNEVLWRVAEEMTMKGDQPGKYSAEDLLRMVRARDTRLNNNFTRSLS